MHTVIRRTLLAAALGALAVVAGDRVDAQTPSTMTVDFLATDDTGQPVRGLMPGDLTLKIGGREVAVHSLDMISAGTDDAPPAGAAAPPSLPPPFAVTAPLRKGHARSILLVIDEGTLFGLEQIVQDSVARLLASLDAADRVGVASTRPGGVTVDFTTSREAIARAIESIVFGRGNTALCVGALIDQVHSLAEALPTGRTTTLALISRGSGSANSVRSAGPGLSTAGGCTFRREQLTPVVEAVSAAQINYHVFHVGGTGLSPNLDNFAGSTGAETGILSWTDQSGLERAVRSSSTFYRAVVDVPSPGREYQRAELRVQRPNVRLRAPQHLARPAAPPPAGDASALLRGELSRADLPIRLTAFASRHAGALPLKLVVVIEPADIISPLYSATVSVVGANGDVAGQWTARRNDLVRLPLVTAVPVAPGDYLVRAAAADEKGRGGVAEYEVTAALAGTGEVELSALALGVRSADGFSPKLLFGEEPEATAYLEVYDAPSNVPVSVVFEIASTPEGAAIASAPGQVTASGGIHMAVGSLPLASVPAGDSIVRARVTVAGVLAGVVTRTLRKSAR